MGHPTMGMRITDLREHIRWLTGVGAHRSAMANT